MEDRVNPYESPEEPAGGEPLLADPTAPATIIPYATARTRATCAVAFLALVSLVSLVSAGSSWMQISLLERIKLGTFTAQEATSNDTREGLVGLATLGTNLGSAIAFLMWMHRAHRNLRSLGSTNLRFTPGWAVGWWFIPVFSLFRPYQVMKEIWKGSDPWDVTEHEDNPWLRPSTALVGWWWASFILMNVVGQVSSRFALQAKEIDELLASSWFSIADGLITLPAALLAVLVVRRVTANQEERYQALVDRADGAAHP